MSSSPLKILLLCEYASLNGGERSMLTAADALQDAPVRLQVAAPSHGPLAEALARRHIRQLRWSGTSVLGRTFSLDQRRELLETLIGTTRPDVVHANSLAMSRLSGPVCQQLGVPSVGHLRDIVKLSSAAVADVNCHHRLLAVSHAARDWHVGQGVAADKAMVVYNGVDLRRFRPRPASGWLHRELQIDPAAPLVAAIGQLGMRKGLDVLLQAAGDVFSRFPDPHLLIVGRRFSGKEEAVGYERQVRQMADTGPLQDRCHFLGVRNDIPRLMNELTLLAHAARQEPLGRVLLEAAASGVPVVATRVGGTEEIFPPPAAVLVPSDDPAALGDGLVRLLGDVQLRWQLSRAARQQAESRFGAQQCARELLTIYRDVAT